MNETYLVLLSTIILSLTALKVIQDWLDGLVDHCLEGRGVKVKIARQ
jgi:hypothetical protein